MDQRSFRRRSGRVIGLGRLVLAAAFLFAIWIDPTQPALYPNAAYGLLALYLGWTTGLLLLTWWNWWLDFRVATFAHMIDVAVFGIIVYLTEGYTSPFYTFFVFLLLAAAIRWSWRETALTAILVLLVFAVAGSLAATSSLDSLDLQRILIRAAHLGVLSILLVWFVVGRRNADPGPVARMLHVRDLTLPIEDMLRQAATSTGAKRLLLLWWHKEEPWIHVARLEADQLQSARHGPDAYQPLFADPSDDRPFLFDHRRGRALRRDPARGALAAFPQTINGELAAEYQLKDGLVVRIRSDSYEGELFALEIDGMSTDELLLADALGQELSMTFERVSVAEFVAEAEVSRAMGSLARDLHDSVVQVLAGAAFRLEALKSWIRQDNDPIPEIESIKSDLAEEQAQVRRYVKALRGGRGALKVADLGSRLPDLCERLEQRWHLDCDLRVSAGSVTGPLWMEHEIHQIVREAAANAARHGGATSITISLDRVGDEIELRLTDNGSGFRVDGGTEGVPAQPVSPWSVYERVKSLGGTLSLQSASQGSQLNIRLPREKSA